MRALVVRNLWLVFPVLAVLAADLMSEGMLRAAVIGLCFGLCVGVYARTCEVGA